MDKAEISISKTIGQRMAEAREICLISQCQASKMLGIDQEELKHLESSLDIESIPNAVISKAAALYDVSTDYLFALTDDWELNDHKLRIERDTFSAITKLHLQNHAETIAQQNKLDNKISTLSKTVEALIPAIKEIDDCFMRFWELNQEFDEMKCGSTFINKLDQALKLAAQAGSDMKRFKLIQDNPLQGYYPDKKRQSPHEKPEPKVSKVQIQALMSSPQSSARRYVLVKKELINLGWTEDEKLTLISPSGRVKLKHEAINQTLSNLNAHRVWNLYKLENGRPKRIAQFADEPNEHRLTAPKLAEIINKSAKNIDKN